MRKTKYTVKYTSGFKKDYKRAIKRGLKIELLEQVVALLAMGEPLPEKNRDHDLSGNWVGHRECHILPDWLLIYRIEDDVLLYGDFGDAVTFDSLVETYVVALSTDPETAVCLYDTEEYHKSVKFWY